MRLKLDELKAFLFPYRTHLEREIEYLKSQVAQHQRRIDVLTERPPLKDVLAKDLMRPAVPRTNRPTPIGWEATRAQERANYVAKAQLAGVPAEPSSGSQNTVDGDGTNG